MSDFDKLEDVPWSSPSVSAKPPQKPTRSGCALPIWVFVGLALLGGLLGYGVSRRLREERGVEEMKFARPVASMKADELLAVYRANEVKAESLMKGFVVVVSGPVNEIGKEYTGGAFVGVGSGLLGSVRASFSKDRLADVASLSKGDTVTLRGIVVGLTAVGQIELQSCRVDSK